MLRKKLIALGLAGITTFGTMVSNTVITIAAPTNTQSSDNMAQGMIGCGLYRLEKFINEGNYKSAVIWQKQLKNHLEVLSKTGQDIAALQKEFDELSKQLDLLKTKKTTNTKSSDNILEAMIHSGIYHLQRLIEEGNYLSAIIWQKQLKNHLEMLSKTGQDTTEFQKEFDKLSKQIDLLKL